MDALVGLVELLEPRQFEPGALIVREGDAQPPPLYIATNGKIDITKRTQSGATRRFAELEAPTLFGEIELFCQIPPVASATALTRVSAFALTRPTFERLFEACQPALMRFTFNVARVACHRLAIADEMMVRGLTDEDLVTTRRAVFADMVDTQSWPTQTGAFKRPK
jgi:CRP-like cAMP-binding protein